VTGTVRRLRPRGERGSVTVFVVGVTVALIVLAGLVFDGGAILAGHREADAEAEGAARAGAEAVASTAREGRSLGIDPGAAVAAVDRYLGAYGHRGTVTVVGDRVTVTVNFTVPMQVLTIVGITHRAVTGIASATAVEGT
jgi:hypothetical protein